jgi:hypothetical protein
MEHNSLHKKMKNPKTVQNLIEKSKRERGANSIHLKHKYISWLGTGTSINSGGFELVSWG